MAHTGNTTGSSSSATPPPVSTLVQPVQPSSPTQADTVPAPIAAPAPWRGVFFDGPEPDQDRDGEEIPIWTVFVGDSDATPLGRIYRVFTFTKAQALARAISHDRRLELHTDAMPA